MYKGLFCSLIVLFILTGEAIASPKGLILENGVLTPYKPPSLAGLTAWVNSSPLQLDQLKGKVVLLEFSTFSYPHSVHTVQHLNEWYRKYHYAGLEIISINSPSQAMEKNIHFIKHACTTFNIHYPVALDNNFSTWTHFNNTYWPAFYLIDKNGDIVYQHFGEGQYNLTENNIRYLLRLNIAHKNQIKGLYLGV